MNNISLKPVIEQLESLFSRFNEKYYNSELQKPVITVSPDMTKGAYGWCTAWKAWAESNTAKSGFYEINLCAEHLSRPFEQVTGTLLHEMVHLHNLQEGVKDTSRGGTYHNKKFKEVAESHGLNVKKDEKYGWTITELNEESKTFLESMKCEKFELYRRSLFQALQDDKDESEDGCEGKESSEEKPKKSSTRKYVCPKCGCIIRATKEVNVLCGDCNVKFEEEA